MDLDPDLCRIVECGCIFTLLFVEIHAHRGRFACERRGRRLRDGRRVVVLVAIREGEDGTSAATQFQVGLSPRFMAIVEKEYTPTPGFRQRILASMANESNRSDDMDLS